MRASSGDYDADDGGLAAWARLAGSVVDAVEGLEISGLAVGVAVVAKRGAAMGDGFVEGFLYGSGEGGDLRRGQPAGDRGGVDSGLVEGFVHIYIAESGQEGLIQ